MSDHDDHHDEARGALKVDTALVRELAELLAETGLSEIEVADGKRSVRVARNMTVAAAPAAAMTVAAPSAAPAPAAPAADDLGNAVRSPMVGTAFLSSEPGSAPFVREGDSVKAGDTLLIIEAMKVMNPIVAPSAGTVQRIIVANGQPVEFDQPLVIVA